MFEKDTGLYDGNYYDYEDDETAILREADIAQEVTEGCYWEDPAFPADGRSLYFDPYCPPKGAMPAESLMWLRIAERNIQDCNNFKTVFANEASAHIIQGALGNSYFVNALRTCDPKYIKRLIVSDRFSSIGLYTIKISKMGKWKYLHIDDRIPCRQSGRVQFCRNVNPNETFAMLLEKAYAKLHGCYEALIHGLIERAMQDLTLSSHVQVIRRELIPVNDVYNSMWTQMEEAFEKKRLVCARCVSADPFADKSSDRKGITLGMPYHVVDMCVAHAEATGDFDAIEVGLVCVRSLQHKASKFSGRWSFGHPIWAQYPEIGTDLSARTDELIKHVTYNANVPWQDVKEQNKEGAADDSKTSKQANTKGRRMPVDPFGDAIAADDSEEEDNFSVSTAPKTTGPKVVQPSVEGLCWMQIEDFVSLFNRVYISYDFDWSISVSTRRFISKWIPGDFIAGSGGPPTSREEPTKMNNAIDDLDDYGNDDDDEEDEASDPFTDNPMYPFLLAEATTITISLYQVDRRWNVSRLDNADPATVNAVDFGIRGSKLDFCMEYPYGLGFVVLKLSGMKVRVTTFKMKRIVANSEFVLFSNCASNVCTLMPGRYVIVPFTDVPCQNTSLDYCLVTQYKQGTLDFEINDILKERPMDDMPSDEEDERAAPKFDIDRGKGLAPKLLEVEQWEWAEESEEVGSIAVYEQISDLATLLRGMQKQIAELTKFKQNQEEEKANKILHEKARQEAMITYIAPVELLYKADNKEILDKGDEGNDEEGIEGIDEKGSESKSSRDNDYKKENKNYDSDDN